MDVTSGSSPAKRTRAKSKDVAAQPQAAKPATTPKKPRTARKATPAPVAQPVVVVESSITEFVASPPSGEEVSRMIATAAYYLAAQRNFSPGHELDDWLEAERQIRANLFG